MAGTAEIRPHHEQLKLRRFECMREFRLHSRSSSLRGWLSLVPDRHRWRVLSARRSSSAAAAWFDRGRARVRKSKKRALNHGATCSGDLPVRVRNLGCRLCICRRLRSVDVLGTARNSSRGVLCTTCPWSRARTHRIACCSFWARTASSLMRRRRSFGCAQAELIPADPPFQSCMFASMTTAIARCLIGHPNVGPHRRCVCALRAVVA